MATEVDDLLIAEQAVQDILKELQSLKAEVGGYASARQSLEGVRQSLDGLIGKTSTLAEKTHAATTILSNIGTPEIISRAETIRLTINQFAMETAKQFKSLRIVVIVGLLISGISLLASLAILATLFLAIK